MSKQGGAPLPASCEGWAAGVEQEVLREVLTATYWFDPGERGKPYSASIRFSGRRIGVAGRPEPRDRFAQEESVEGIVPGSGPASITIQVRNVNPGKWIVSAEPVLRARPARLLRSFPWSPSREPVATRIGAFASIPGVVPGAWPGLVGLGILVGVAFQVWLLAQAHLDVRSSLLILSAAMAVGLVGAKAWYIVLHQRPLRGWFNEGMCIQGFLLAAVLVALGGLALSRVAAGTFFDAISPGIFFGMAVGRCGCFFAGCCAGRPTASRWALWASDRRLGARRFPTQLLESLLCLAIGLLALASFLRLAAVPPGSLFVGGFAAYTLFRQLLLPARSEPRKSASGRFFAMGAASTVLIADLVISSLSLT